MTMTTARTITNIHIFKYNIKNPIPVKVRLLKADINIHILKHGMGKQNAQICKDDFVFSLLLHNIFYLFFTHFIINITNMKFFKL